MAAAKIRTSGFSRNISTAAPSLGPGLKYGPNGTVFLSSGIPELDKVLGGGFPLGSLVMVMEDAEAPHHMLLLRNFMAQGLVHGQPLLYASPSRDPRGFLGTLPSPAASKDDKSREPDPNQEKDGKREYSNEFDLRKPLERHLINVHRIDCVSIQETFPFLSQFPRNDGSISCAGRIAIQSFCALQCAYSNMEREMLSFIRSLKSMVQSSNSVAIITFPPSLLSSSLGKRWQHIADTLLSVKAIQDEDKELAQLLTGYQDMVGFLNVHKVSHINAQVPVILEATTFSIKCRRVGIWF